MKTEYKAVIASVVVIALCLCAVGGVTYSWFSDSDQSDIDIDTATVDVSIDINSFATTSGMGSATLDNGVASISNLTANCKFNGSYTISNSSTIDIVYRTYATISGTGLTETDREMILIGVDEKNAVPLSSATTLESGTGIVLQDWTSMSQSTASAGPFGFYIGTDRLWNNSNVGQITISIHVEAYQGDYIASVSTVDELKTALSNGSNVVLTNDITDNSSTEGIVISDNGVTIDLAGHSLTLNAADVAIQVNSGASLTINGDGTVRGGSGGNNITVAALPGSNVVINGGTYSVGPDASNSGNSCIYSTGGDIVINGGVFSSDVAYNNQYYVLNVLNGSGGSISVTGGSFVNFDPSNGDDHDGGNFVADGYTVVSSTSGDDTTYTVVADLSNGQTIDSDDPVISGAVNVGTETAEITVSFDSSAASVVNGGTISVDASPSAPTGFTISGNDTMTLNFSIDNADTEFGDGYADITVTVPMASEPQTVNVIYNGIGEQPTVVNHTYTDGKLTVTFRTNHFSEFIVTNTDDVSVSNETALAASLVYGMNVTLANDISISNRINIPAGVTSTLDLENYDITSTQYCFRVFGELTINGTGTVESGTSDPVVANYEYLPIWASNGGIITINGGTYIAHDFAEVVYVDGNEVSGKVIINGGTFQSTSSDTKAGYLLNVSNGAASADGIIVYGGVFYNYDPSTGDDNHPDKVSFVASGSTVTPSTSGNDKIYTVTSS